LKQLIDELMDVSEAIRYVAVYLDGNLESVAKPETEGASSSESDRYEELLVNPGILTLARQRGNIDCGGTEYVLIRYGNFFQFVIPLSNGHVSVCIEPNADPISLGTQILEIVTRHLS
jgi:hypothetical protein